MRKLILSLVLVSVASLLAACESTGGNQQARQSEFNCIAGTVGGAVIGGLLGSTIGGGTGKTIATAAGAGGGGYAGHRFGCR